MSAPQQRWVLPPERSSAHRARRLVEAACDGLPDEQVDAALLLVTELVANAVIHGTGPVLLELSRDHDSVRIEVSDGSPEPPVLVPAGDLRESGAGLRLVDALSDEWGTATRSDGRPGKQVWFTLT